MTCASDFTGWASGILESLNETGIATGSVANWLRSNLGLLNVRLRTTFSLNESGCVTGSINSAQSGIYTEMYYCYYYQRKANEMMGAASYDWVEIQGEDQGKIKRISQNDVAKNFMNMKKDTCEHVDSLVTWYHKYYNPLVSRQVLYNDRDGVSDSGLTCAPPCSFYSPYNYVWQAITDE